jgi:2-isopropylmalate synthase
VKIEILDTTLRDGEQGAGVEFSYDDKIRVITELDSLGVSYMEAGMITNSDGADFFNRLGKLDLKNSKLSVFTVT